MNVTELRRTIDKLDRRIVALINQRAGLAQEIGRSKGGGVKYRPSREDQVIRNVLAANDGPLAGEAIVAAYREIIAGCLSLEQPLRVSYLGPAGTYSEEAARKRFGTVAELVPCATLDESLATAEKEQTDVAVLPVENSTEGPVNRTLDLLMATSLGVVGEIELPIHHQLLTKAKKIADIETVAAHPQALAQCHGWLQQHLPHAHHQAMNSNAEAAEAAASQPRMAAIAGLLAAKQYDLPILARNIEDDSSNTTRFLVLSSTPTQSTGHDKTSLICSVPNRPGSLGKLIAVLANAGVNMTKLTSRPSPTGLWDYVFYIDLGGHRDDPAVARALDGLTAHASFVRILGSYPREVR